MLAWPSASPTKLVCIRRTLQRLETGNIQVLVDVFLACSRGSSIGKLSDKLKAVCNELYIKPAELSPMSMVLQSQFGFGLREAAHNLRICPTTLKRACRRHGIHRWPRRQGSAGDASRQESMNLDTDSVTSLGATDGDQPTAAAAVTACTTGKVLSKLVYLSCPCQKCMSACSNMHSPQVAVHV